MNSRLISDKFKVLADVDGNSPFTTTTDTIQFEVVCLPKIPEQVPVSKLRRTTENPNVVFGMIVRFSSKMM